MNHNSSSDVAIRLQDGKSLLSEWSHHFDTLPTIGERLHIEDVSGDVLSGYRDSAMVSRVERDLKTGLVTLVLDAVPVSEKENRNVVFLNSNYIPAEQHQEIEGFVRNHVDLPVFEWVDSQQPAPIVEFHGPTAISRPALGQLQAKIRNLLAESSPLAVI
ncbi:MAG TPA: hypothetical protein VM511_02205 [Luteolibacter sp.]|nr:hypothetical protein [Luteolibacter sp.]